MRDQIEEKQKALERHLAALHRALVAYSGGVDSAYLAYVAHRVLGDNALAVIADSPSLARTQLADAVAFAREQDFALEIISTHEVNRPDYMRNDRDRCFYCKDELFRSMEELGRARSFAAIIYGMNLDDLGEYRPGQAAAREHKVIAPLVEARLSKANIRELARAAGLRLWDKPASACLSSRVEYGRAVTPDLLRTVEQGEEAMHRLGFRQCRVRHHGPMVRIEIAQEELARAFNSEIAAELARIFKALGFKFVTLDLEGFRSGSMNALLPLANLTRKAS